MHKPRNRKPKARWRLVAPVALAVAAALAVLLTLYVSRTKFELRQMDTGETITLYEGPSHQTARADRKSALARFATGSIASLETPAALTPAPTYVFKTADGADARFADFRGRVVLVNLWAMWCAPCRTEMPTLAALATAYAGRDLVVLPINVDVGADALADASSFIGVHEPLPLYTDPKFQLPFEFPGKGKMPQTILLDRQGRVRATFAGEADWSSAEARALIDAVMAEPA